MRYPVLPEMNLRYDYGCVLLPYAAYVTTNGPALQKTRGHPVFGAEAARDLNVKGSFRECPLHPARQKISSTVTGLAEAPRRRSQGRCHMTNRGSYISSESQACLGVLPGFVLGVLAPALFLGRGNAPPRFRAKPAFGPFGRPARLAAVLGSEEHGTAGAPSPSARRRRTCCSFAISRSIASTKCLLCHAP